MAFAGANEAFQVMWLGAAFCHGDKPDQHYGDGSVQGTVIIQKTFDTGTLDPGCSSYITA